MLGTDFTLLLLLLCTSAGTAFMSPAAHKRASRLAFTPATATKHQFQSGLCSDENSC